MPSNRGFEALPDRRQAAQFDEPHAVIANRHTHAATMIDKQPAMNPETFVSHAGLRSSPTAHAVG